MSVYKQEQPRREGEEQSDDVVWQSADTVDVDDILDQIDSVLEVNAEEFVRGFVQKGGQ